MTVIDLRPRHQPPELGSSSDSELGAPQREGNQPSVRRLELEAAGAHAGLERPLGRAGRSCRAGAVRNGNVRCLGWAQNDAGPELDKSPRGCQEQERLSAGAGRGGTRWDVHRPERGGAGAATSRRVPEPVRKASWKLRQNECCLGVGAFPWAPPTPRDPQTQAEDTPEKTDPSVTAGTKPRPESSRTPCGKRVWSSDDGHTHPPHGAVTRAAAVTEEPSQPLRGAIPSLRTAAFTIFTAKMRD